jgi:superfamily II DNA or RNA helicase
MSNNNTNTNKNDPDVYTQSRMENMKQNKYVDLKINGRLFPSWVLANFKDSKLPSIVRDPAKDPCDIKLAKEELRAYQTFISRYLDFKSPYRNMLLYHGMGSGKTATAINVYNSLYNYTPGWNVFILVKASLRGNWLKELRRWLKKDEYEFRYKNIIFINYDSPIAERKFLDAVKNVDSSKKSLYIVDEVHNFIKNVHSNISSTSGKRAQIIYDYIIQDKKENPDTRLMLLSATPAINNPFELALLFNMLRPGILPKSENQFNHLFITDANYQTINNSNKNLFQRRITGLVSFYIGATPDLYATKTMNYVDIPMSSYQQDVYTSFEEYEEAVARKARFRDKKGPSMYKSYTRQACNFVFPAISQRINGEARPRPGKFRVSEREAMKMTEGKKNMDSLKSEKGSDKFMNVTKYVEAMNTFINSFDAHLSEKNKKDKDAKHTIYDDIKTFQKKYDSDFIEFDAKEKKKSNLYLAMRECSGKMTNVVFNIMVSPGPVLVYSNYVLMEGLEIFKMYLKYVNFYNFTKLKKYNKDKLGYVEFHGGIKDIDERYKGMDAFNLSENKFGEQIKVIMISPAGSEGLSLKNVRQVHIMEPHWNEVRINQMVGRAVRQCSHRDLKLENRHVNVFRYKSVRSVGDKWTTDQVIEDIARGKEGLIQSFLDAIKESAIDCMLNKNHNMLQQEYKCFQFDETSLFDKYVGPAYKEDIFDDMKIDNGSNNNRSISLKVKVMKITAVKLLSNPTDDDKPEYSKPSKYWYYAKSGTVYDPDLHYAIGRVGFDDENIPMKLDKETYIITHLVPIPTL